MNVPWKMTLDGSLSDNYDYIREFKRLAHLVKGQFINLGYGQV
jgi:hypothetical protein